MMLVGLVVNLQLEQQLSTSISAGIGNFSCFTIFFCSNCKISNFLSARLFTFL